MNPKTCLEEEAKGNSEMVAPGKIVLGGLL